VGTAQRRDDDIRVEGNDHIANDIFFDSKVKRISASMAPYGTFAATVVIGRAMRAE
jgi:hypothetical protein